MTRIHRIPLLISLLATLTACGGGESANANNNNNNAAASKAKAAAAVGAIQAKELFDSLCFTCHGKTGKGDGPGAAALDPKPRTFTDDAWQDSVTDEHIEKAIVYGGAGVGKSVVMPANPQLKGKTTVLAALVKIVRGFRGK